VVIQQFSADRILSNVNLKWSTAQEINIHHFELEVAKGNEAFQSEQFEKIAEVISKGRSAVSQSYSFVDNTPDKKGVRYYRLKNVDVFGNYNYSKAIPVVFSEELEWQVFPNPSNGKYNLLYQSAPGDQIQLSIINSVGQLVKQMNFTANGFIQRQDIDLSKNVFANGVYVLQIKAREKTHVLRLVKQ
ncbi:MAG TPA: T9SS type A sorting domain-containing protein, partial [Flavisolibacter sp.]|nr:T9SS type A sorting domain-containing protein [Flavisolibacter sp.]